MFKGMNFLIDLNKVSHVYVYDFKDENDLKITIYMDNATQINLEKADGLKFMTSYMNHLEYKTKATFLHIPNTMQ